MATCSNRQGDYTQLVGRNNAAGKAVVLVVVVNLNFHELLQSCCPFMIFHDLSWVVLVCCQTDWTSPCSILWMGLLSTLQSLTQLCQAKVSVRIRAPQKESNGQRNAPTVTSRTPGLQMQLIPPKDKLTQRNKPLGWLYWWLFHTPTSTNPHIYLGSDHPGSSWYSKLSWQHTFHFNHVLSLNAHSNEALTNLEVIGIRSFIKRLDVKASTPQASRWFCPPSHIELCP